MDLRPLSQQHRYLKEKNVFLMLKSPRARQRQRERKAAYPQRVSRNLADASVHC